MIPPVCFTCRRCLAEIDIPYNNDLRKIDNDTTLSTKEKNDQKAALLDKYMITNYCCRTRCLGQTRLVEIYT
jgi:DNA-directed RNA polymerase subunit N (RpoN/RPB10)